MLRICAAFVLICLPLMASANPQGRIRIIDADTWDVGSTRVRLHGIDAPELA
ncbi:MAG: endonuclease YncB(thermonuclease family), partial [Paracoccaceae bacterium]